MGKRLYSSNQYEIQYITDQQSSQDHSTVSDFNESHNRQAINNYVNTEKHVLLESCNFSKQTDQSEVNPVFELQHLLCELFDGQEQNCGGK